MHRDFEPLLAPRGAHETSRKGFVTPRRREVTTTTTKIDRQDGSISAESTTSQSMDGTLLSTQRTERADWGPFKYVPTDVWYRILPFLSFHDILSVTYTCRELYEYVSRTLVLDPLCLNAMAGADWFLQMAPLISKVVARSLGKARSIIVQAEHYHSCYPLTGCIGTIFSGTTVMGNVERLSVTLGDSRLLTGGGPPLLCLPNCKDLWLALYNLPEEQRQLRLACPALERMVVSEDLKLEGVPKHTQVAYLTSATSAAESPMVRSAKVHFASGHDGASALCEPVPDVYNDYIYRRPSERQRRDEYCREHPVPSPKRPYQVPYIWKHADDQIAFSAYFVEVTQCDECVAFARSFEQLGLAPRHRPRSVPQIYMNGRQRSAYLRVFEPYSTYKATLRAEALEAEWNLRPKRGNLKWEFVRSSDAKCNKVLDELISAVGNRSSRVSRSTSKDVILVASTTRDFIRWSIAALAEKEPRKRIAYVLIANEPVDTQEIQNVYLFAQKHVGCVRVFWQRLRFFPPEYAQAIAELITGQLKENRYASTEPWIKSFPGTPLYYVPEPHKSHFRNTIQQAIRTTEIPYTGCVRFEAYTVGRRPSTDALSYRLMLGQTPRRL